MDLPERGGGSVKQTSPSALIGRGSHGSALFWAGPRPGTGDARPLHACGLDKKELERLEKPNRNCGLDVFALYAVASEARVASAGRCRGWLLVCLLDGLLDSLLAGMLDGC